MLAFNKIVNAQKDTAFWFAAPEISASVGDNPIFLRFLSYQNPSVVTISQPANGLFVPVVINLPANSIDSFDLTPFLSSVESPAGNIVATNGLKITASTEITTYYELVSSTSKEKFSLKGNKSLGTNFYTPFQKFWNNGVTTPKSFSSIDIVASENNTTVLITPKTNVIGHNANVSFSVVLNEGETYSVRDTNVLASTSLSGSIVSSNKPIALTVFSGALSNSGCKSTVGDQITPTNYIGNDYIIHRGNSTSDKVYILSTQNATNINIQNSTTTSTLINWSETYEYDLLDSITYIHTSKPVYIFQVSGNGCSLSGTQVPNLFCTGTYSTAFSRANADSLNLFLFVRSGFENNFELNGNTSIIPASSFYNVPGTNGEYKAANIYLSTTDVAVNSYNELVNTGDVFGLGLLSGTNNSGSAFTYLSEYVSYPFIEAGNNDTVCANTVFNLNGIVGGGDITGIWSGTGFGSFSLPIDSLNNQYIVSQLDTAISPVKLILTTTGRCLQLKDTIQLYITPAPLVNASVDQTVCANNTSVQLNGSVAGGATTGIWSSVGGGTFTPNNTVLNPVYIPSATEITNGLAKIVLTSTNFGACNEVTDTMKIFITNSPVVDAGLDTLYVCENNNLVNLNGSVSGSSLTGKWTSSGNGFFLPDNVTLNSSYQPNPSDIINGYVTLYLLSTNNGNCIAAKDSLKVLFTPKPVVDAGTNLISCANNSAVSLNGVISGPTTTGYWTGGNGTYTIDSTDLNATYFPSSSEIASGIVSLTLKSTNNQTCISESDIVQINIVTPPLANFSFSNVCLGKSINFTDFSLNGFGTITSWNWDFDDLTTSTTQNNIHTYNSANTYNVELIVNSSVGCSDTIVKAVEVYEIPIADFTYTSSCNSNLIVLDFNDSSVSTNAINYWFYDFGTQGNTTNENPSQLFTTNGNYNITHVVGTVNGCLDTIVKTIVIPPKPTAGFYYNTVNGLNIGAVFNFIDTSSNASSFNWNFGDGNTSIDQNPSNTFFANGTYYITQIVQSAFGCTDSITLPITINTVTQEINTLIPNAISPNGDGKNDVWKLDFIQYLNATVKVDIFNRWGQLIFHSDDYASPWDGTFNGSLVEDGTYFYVINLNDGKESIYKGSILVMQKGK